MSEKENPLSSAERSKLWRERHPGADAEKTKRYRNTDKGQLNESKKSNKRRMMDYNALQLPYTKSEVLERYGNICHICQEPIDLNAPKRVGYKGWEAGLHLDHVIPLARGGNDTIENIRPSHGICNIRKGATLTDNIGPIFI